MTGETLSVREGASVAEATAQLRARKVLPHQADTLFVVDSRNVLRGVLPLKELLLHAPETAVSDGMNAEPVVLEPQEPAREASLAFERYGLISAPVVDERGKLLGRVSVDAVVDFIRHQSELAALKRAGLSGEEDLFAPARESARNRWVWLSVNLVTAFLASRVIGVFEEAIHGLVALATLMPIVASIGGNTGNQTVALMIRGLALDQVTRGNTGRLFRKELSVALLNGVVFGSLVGLAASLLYGSASLGVVMAAAVLLNLLVAALVAVAVPIALRRSGRDPAQGSSVLLTFTTDGMGFFIFLGLAKAFLL
jgi:magnesium transporter